MGVKGLFLYLARFCISVVVLVGKGVKGWKYLGRDGFKESTVIMGYGLGFAPTLEAFLHWPPERVERSRLFS